MIVLCMFDVLSFTGLVFLFVFFFKQKTAYEMRISDWSSDVCSSDLLRHPLDLVGDGAQLLVERDAVEFLRVIFQLGLAILIPEEARIRQARRQHLAVDRKSVV